MFDVGLCSFLVFKRILLSGRRNSVPSDFWALFQVFTWNGFIAHGRIHAVFSDLLVAECWNGMQCDPEGC